MPQDFNDPSQSISRASRRARVSPDFADPNQSISMALMRRQGACAGYDTAGTGDGVRGASNADTCIIGLVLDI
jgi:hypothetical protein